MLYLLFIYSEKRRLLSRWEVMVGTRLELKVVGIVKSVDDVMLVEW